MMTTLAVCVQAFLLVKLAAVACFLFVCVVRVASGRVIPLYPRLLWFYGVIALAGIAWSLVGLLYPGTFTGGVFDALRLYCLWSAAFLLLFSLMRSETSLDVVHRSFVLAGIVISAVNLYGLADQFWSLGLIPDSVRRELELFIGINDGYIQITSINIGMLFLIVPYLLVIHMRSDARRWTTRAATLSLFVSLVLVAASGRRALVLVVALTPALVLLTAWLSSSMPLLRPMSRRFCIAYCAGIVAVGAGASALPASLQDSGYVYRLKSAFSSQDERSIQKGYLVDGFVEAPVLGSGFGAYAGYLRSAERPWTYELTYHKMLFNLGLVGMALVGGVHAAYVGFVVLLLRRFRAGSASAFGLLVGLLALLLGAWSNPYLGSFDYLFFLGLLPYLTTFTQGFAIRPIRIPAGAVR